MDLQVLSTTSRTAQSQTGSQEVRGFESLRLHSPKVLVTSYLGVLIAPIRGHPSAGLDPVLPTDMADGHVDRGGPMCSLSAPVARRDGSCLHDQLGLCQLR